MAAKMIRHGIGRDISGITAAADNFGNAGAAVALGAGNNIGVVIPTGLTRDQAVLMLEDIRTQVLDGRLTSVFPS